MGKLAQGIGWGLVILNGLGLLAVVSSDRPVSAHQGILLAELGDPLRLASMGGEIVGMNLFSLVAFHIALFSTKKGTPLPGYGVAAGVLIVAGVGIYLASLAQLSA